MTARLDAIGNAPPESAETRAAPGDDPLATFQLEPQKAGKGSGDGVALRMGAVTSPPSATTGANTGSIPTAGVVNRIKTVLRALDITRGLEETVNSRLATLSGIDQGVQDRARRLEWLNNEIKIAAAHADDILRAIGSFEWPLADLNQRQQDLRAIETTVTALENRAQTVSTSLGRDVAACEVREAAVVDALEQLERRAADTVNGLEGHVGDCEARADVAKQTITHLDDVSSRMLPVLQDRMKEAEEQIALCEATPLSAIIEAFRAKVQ